MRLRRVTFQNFKRFENLEIELRWLDCLVGANNSGKTTLLQGLALFDFCVHHCLERKNGEFELKKRTISPEDFYVLPVTNPMDIWHDRRTMAGKKQRRVKIAAEFDTGDTATVTIKLDYNRFGISTEISDDSQESLNRLKELRIAYLPVFSMFSPREERRLSVAIEDELVRGRVHSVVRNLLLEIKVQNRANELTDVLRRSFPSLKDLRIEFDEVTDRYITVTYKEENRPKEFDIFSAGSGFQQFLYLFGFILLRQPTVVLLDEPDVHLHGSLQAVLLDELKNLVDGGGQVLFATHSRELITRVSPENILSLDDEGAKRLQVAFDIYDTLDRLGSVDPSQLPLIQAFRRVVVVEDRTDRNLLSIFCTKCLGTEIWQQVERRVAFCYSKGNPWKQHDMPRLRALLQQTIAIQGPPLQLFVIADSDYHPDAETLESELTQPNLSWHIWRRAEIENYLLNLEPVKRVLRQRESQRVLDEMALQQQFEALIEASRDCANDALVQTFDEIRKLKGEKWDPAGMTRKAREYLEKHWETRKVELADAKDIVLPGIKRWLQETGIGSFSDVKLADSFEPDDLPQEVSSLARRLAEFAGIRLS